MGQLISTSQHQFHMIDCKNNGNKKKIFWMNRRQLLIIITKYYKIRSKKLMPHHPSMSIFLEISSKDSKNSESFSHDNHTEESCILL